MCIRDRFVGVLAAMLVSVGNAGGVGTTVAGVSRVPFVVGLDRYLPAAFGKIHPKWKTPYVAILVQAVISAIILLAIQINETANSAYQILVDATTIVYFIAMIYMYAAAIRLAYRKDRYTCLLYTSNTTALIMLSFLPGVLLLYYAVGRNFLDYGAQRNLVYALPVTLLALLYLALVRRVGTWLEPVIPPEATASVLRCV